MAAVSEALRNFLNARQTPANADLIERWGIYMETQVNVAVGEGEPVAGKRSTYVNGGDSWWNIRVPKDANSEPSWDDYELRYSLTDHAEGIGCTGWDWPNRRSRWVAFDFDDLTGHAKGVGVTDEALQKVQEAAIAASLPGNPAEHRRQRTTPLRLFRGRWHSDREPHSSRRAGPLHPGHDVRASATSTSPRRSTAAAASCGFGIAR